MKISYRIQRKSKKILRDLIFKKEFVKKTKYGFKIKLDVSRDVDKHFYWGEFEVGNLVLLKSLLKDCQTFFDIGANIGIYSLLASKHMRHGGKVYSFEPSDWAYKRLMENLELNNIKNVEVFKQAATNSAGTKQFYLCEDDAYNSLNSSPMKAVQKVIDIECIRIDDFCSEHKIKKIDILKVDAEGTDYLVLKGAENILKSETAPIIMCEFNKKILEGLLYTKNDFVRLLRDLSYSVFVIKGENLIKIDLENAEASELICLKDYHIDKYDLNIKMS
ncbi:MAG TPA: FkbM family methyltransferase [Ignavibacteriaceae bacterium]|nr:FkbM family methyltransferase [Ignavibacteriaceae bacterium]